ncbi:MAG: hypothetical protein ACO1SX_21215 [Actinomycetota bacterium]
MPLHLPAPAIFGGAFALLAGVLSCAVAPGGAAEDAAYYSEGELRGSLRSEAPLAIYHTDPQHLWNRLFAALYTRRSDLPSTMGGPPVKRIEGGDVLEFLGWGKTTYWSEPGVAVRVTRLLEEFVSQGGAAQISDPVRRILFQNDLWAAHDHLVGQNIAWFGTAAERRRRARMATLLARAIRALAVPTRELEALPDNFALAAKAGAFAPTHDWDAKRDYFPTGVLTEPETWSEIDFFQPNLHEDIEGRFITLHTRHFRGRSYFRAFYRFPGGRKALDEYLQYVEREGVDWKFGAQNGFLRLKPGLRQIPAGTEVALVQFLIGLDTDLKPVPTRLVQSVRLRTFRNSEGAEDASTHSGKGMNVYEYVLRRRLALNGMKHGGLEREPNDLLQYRLVFEGNEAPDWGRRGRLDKVSTQCVSCHSGQGPGAYTLVTLINQGGFDAGAMMGVAHALKPGAPSPRGPRAARWKQKDETYRRLVEAAEDHP